jgi:hypothetical protein
LARRARAADAEYAVLRFVADVADVVVFAVEAVDFAVVAVDFAVVVFFAAVFDALLEVVVAGLFFVAVVDVDVVVWADATPTATAREAEKRHVRRIFFRDQARITDNPLRDSLLEVVSAL